MRACVAMSRPQPPREPQRFTQWGSASLSFGRGIPVVHQFSARSMTLGSPRGPVAGRVEGIIRIELLP